MDLCNWRPFFLMGGSLCFMNALITPLVIQLNYNSLPDGLFINFYDVIELGLANVMSISIISLIIYLILQQPLEKACSRLANRYFS